MQIRFQIFKAFLLLATSIALLACPTAWGQRVSDPLVQHTQHLQSQAETNTGIFQTSFEITDGAQPISELTSESTIHQTLPVYESQPVIVEGMPPGNEVYDSCTDLNACTEPSETTESCTAPSKEPCTSCGLFGSLFGGCNDIDAACAGSHKKLHYWNDYSYIDEDDYDGHCLGDGLKRLGKDHCPKDNWLDVGGRFRLRYHNENGLGRLAGSELFDDNETNHLLTQVRLFGDWHVNDTFRVFAEGIYADATGATLGYIPRANERNRGDFLNLFVDMQISESTTVRLGRQQMLYGSRRLIAGPGWANTSRSHDGIKIIQKFGNLRVDSFYMQRTPVLVDDFDETDFDRALFGVWGTYKGSRDTLDLYYLGFEDDRVGREFFLHTIGGRISGGDKWLFDIEGAGQFGEQTAMGVDHSAAFATAGVGRKLDLPWSPTLWGYFDFATGDSPGGSFNGYNWIFNRAHHYLGFIDLNHRRNIEIPSLELTLNPTDRFSILARYFHVQANNENDTIFALGGLTANQNSVSTDYGDTIDLMGKYVISPRSSARVGYSYFWRGNRIIGDEDPSLLFAEWAIWF